jgi:hypothetical protein
MRKISLLFTLLIVQFVTAQDGDKPAKHFSLGLKAGIPNIVSVNGELVLPILNNHLAVFGDYGAFNLEDGSTEVGLKYTEFGAHLYFGSRGKGLYIGAGMGTLSTDLTFNDLTFEDQGTSVQGSATTGLDINTTNLKLGLKTGGTIYFRIEVGYGLGTVPDQIQFTATSQGITETFTEDIPAIPGVSTTGFAIGNIGFGISF